MELDTICNIFKKLYNKYRMLYSKKEIKTCLIISIFICYMLENKEKYNLKISSILEKEILLILAQKGRACDIEIEIINPIEMALNLKSHISNVYRNFKMIKDCQFMEEIFREVLNIDTKNSRLKEAIVEFINLTLDKDEIKEGKSVNDLIAKIVNVKEGQKVLDNFAGIGQTVMTAIKDKKQYIQLQEIDEEQCAIATILLVMEGYKNFKILNTNSLIYLEKEPFDLVISIPPLVLDTTELGWRYGEKFYLRNKRDNWAGLNVSFESLSRYGTLITAVNTGALTSTKKSDEYIRKELFRRGYIRTIIELPEKMMYGTNVKISLLEINKFEYDETLLINLNSKYASKYLIKSPSTGLTEFTEQALDEILQLIRERKESEISRIIRKDEILDNDVLLPSLYMIQEEKYNHKDLYKMEKERKELKEEAHILENEYIEILGKISREE